MVVASPSQTGLTTAWTQLRFHPEQHRLWTAKSRVRAVVAGRGSGKTELAKRFLVTQLPLPKPWRDPRYFFGAPTIPQGKRIAWYDLVAMTPKSWVRDINRSELCIRTVFGSELWVFGLDEPARVEGLQWDGCVIDESCDQKPRVFDLSVLPALTHRNGWCWRIGAAKRQGPGAEEFRTLCEKADRGELPGTEHFTWSAEDILSPEMLAYARANMDAADYAEQFCAQWQTLGGGIYHAFDERYNKRPCPYRPNLPVIVGSDFNVDPMCWVFGHRIDIDHLEWFDELFLRNSNTPHALDVTWEKFKNHRSGFEFYGDATARQRNTAAKKTDYDLIEADVRFRKAGRTVRYPEGNPAMADRWAAVNAMFCNADGDRRMHIDPKCRQLLADCRRAGFKPGTRLPVKEGDIGHMTDAMGYPVFKLFPVRVPIEFEAPVISLVSA